MKLYHFTNRVNLEKIVQDGVINTTESNVHMIQEHYGPDVVWLLDRPKLEYGHGINFALGDPEYDKTQVRIDVEVEGAIKWSDWIWTHKMKPRTAEKLIESGGGALAAHQWYVLPRPIPAKEWRGIHSLGKGLEGFSAHLDPKTGEYTFVHGQIQRLPWHPIPMTSTLHLAREAR